MSDDHETSETIDLTAAEWVSRADRGPLSRDDEARLKTWLAGDIRRQGAYIRARAVSARSRRAGALGRAYSSRVSKPDVDRSRRRFMAAGGGALAAATVAGVVVTWGGSAGEAYASASREVRRIPLPDGSRLVLNSDSQIEAVFSDASRLVRIKEGEALFETVADPGRPFTIAAKGVEIVAQAAVFSVNLHIDRSLRLTVGRGEADIHQQGFGSSRSWKVGASVAANIRPGNGWFEGLDVKLVRLPESEVVRAHAWRDGQLAFTGQTLAQAAAEFSRYNGVCIRITDPRLAAEPIVGLFAMDDPAGFARVIAASFDAAVTLNGDEVIVGR